MVSRRCPARPDFDDAFIEERGLTALRSRYEAFQPHSPFPPPTITLSAFQATYEAVMGAEVDPLSTCSPLLRSARPRRLATTTNRRSLSDE